MNKEKLFKTIFMLLLIIYLCIYFSSVSGLYEYKNYKKVSLTSEQINKFEQDIKDGKPINIDNYIIEERTMHNNKLGNMGKKLSYTISDSMKKVLSTSYDFLSKFVA
jgi:hypothetical protein